MLVPAETPQPSSPGPADRASTRLVGARPILEAAAPFGWLRARLLEGPGTERGSAGSRTVVLWPSIFSTGDVQKRLADDLAREHRVLLIDPPGHGRSVIEQPRDLTMTSCASATLALLDQIGVRETRWVGTSWGGLVGLDAARLAPERIEHLACLNTPFSFRRGGWTKLAWLPFMTRWLGTSKLFADGVAGDFFLRTTRAGEAFGEAMQVHRRVFSEGDRRQLAAAAALIFKRRADVMPELHAVSRPVLVVAGTRDRLYPEAMQREAARRLKNGVFASVDSAHIAAVDAPGEVARLLRQAWSDLDRTSEATTPGEAARAPAYPA